jgi:hypothetical protein
MDPELQIALGVLFYGNTDYDRAKDCFESALAVRPRVRSAFCLRVLIERELKVIPGLPAVEQTRLMSFQWRETRGSPRRIQGSAQSTTDLHPSYLQRWRSLWVILISLP